MNENRHTNSRPVGYLTDETGQQVGSWETADMRALHPTSDEVSSPGAAGYDAFTEWCHEREADYRRQAKDPGCTEQAQMVAKRLAAEVRWIREAAHRFFVLNAA